MEPVTAQCNFESVDLLINGFETLRIRCVEGITANEEKCRDYVRNSISIVTALNPVIGYKHSTQIAKEAMRTGRSVYDLVLEQGILSKEDLDTILAPREHDQTGKTQITNRSNKPNTSAYQLRRHLRPCCMLTPTESLFHVRHIPQPTSGSVSQNPYHKSSSSMLVKTYGAGSAGHRRRP